MTDPTLQSRLDDALRDCDEQRAELVRLRERVAELEVDLLAAETALADERFRGAGTADDMRRERAARLENVPKRVTDWPEYRAEGESK